MLNGSHLPTEFMIVVHLFKCIFNLGPRAVKMLQASRYLYPALVLWEKSNQANSITVTCFMNAWSYFLALRFFFKENLRTFWWIVLFLQVEQITQVWAIYLGVFWCLHQENKFGSATASIGLEFCSSFVIVCKGIIVNQSLIYFSRNFHLWLIPFCGSDLCLC